MLLADWLEIGPLTSLAVILAILAVTVTASLTRSTPDPQLKNSPL
jgi:hypothetical protein